MDLLNTETTTNLLPGDGVVNYYGKVLRQGESQYYLDKLLNTIEWQNGNHFWEIHHHQTKSCLAWRCWLLIYLLEHN